MTVHMKVTFLLRVTVTLLTHTARGGHTLCSIYLLYLQSTGWLEGGGSMGFDKQRQPMLLNTVPHFAFLCSSFLK